MPPSTNSPVTSALLYKVIFVTFIFPTAKRSCWFFHCNLGCSLELDLSKLLQPPFPMLCKDQKQPLPPRHLLSKKSFHVVDFADHEFLGTPLHRNSGCRGRYDASWCKLKQGNCSDYGQKDWVCTFISKIPQRVGT